MQYQSVKVALSSLIHSIDGKSGKICLNFSGISICATPCFGKAATADLEEDRPQLADEIALGLTYDQIDDFLEGKAIPTEAEDKLLGIYKATAHKHDLPAEFF
nr:hypothetical protein [Vibrio hepatarius]